MIDTVDLVLSCVSFGAGEPFFDHDGVAIHHGFSYQDWCMHPLSNWSDLGKRRYGRKTEVGSKSTSLSSPVELGEFIFFHLLFFFVRGVHGSSSRPQSQSQMKNMHIVSQHIAGFYIRARF